MERTCLSGAVLPYPVALLTSFLALVLPHHGGRGEEVTLGFLIPENSLSISWSTTASAITLAFDDALNDGVLSPNYTLR